MHFPFVCTRQTKMKIKQSINLFIKSHLAQQFAINEKVEILIKRCYNEKKGKNMIIARTPLRVSFCGGGSDIESFYKNNGGCVISTSINRYVYLSIHPTFMREKTILKYSETEIVDDTSEIKHKIFKQVLQDMDIKGVEIDSEADIPAGTGLGSSSSFTVCLLHLLNAYKGKFVSKERLASDACDVEIKKLKEPIGKQDQYAAAFGGLKYYKFNKDGSVYVEPIILSQQQMNEIENNLMLFYTGDVRSASKILAEQTRNISAGEKEENQRKICELTEQLKIELEKGNLDAIGEILHKSWLLKRSLASGITNPLIDESYEKALNAGAIGGKLLGAGGGGFLLFYVKQENQEKVKQALSNLKYMKFGFDKFGSSIIYVGENTHWE